MGFEWAPGGLQAEIGVTLKLVWARIASADVSQGADRGEDTRNSTAGVPALNRSEMSKSRSWCLPWRRRSAQSRLSGRESLDNCHRPPALWACPEWSRNISRWRADDRVRFGGCGQQREAQRQQLRAAPVGQEPEVPDAHEAPRQHVQTEPPQKLIQRQPHEPLLVVVRRVAPAEHDLSVFQSHQTMIRDRYPVRVTAEIA